MKMNQYQIYDTRNTSLLSDYPVYNANRPVEALRKYLADKGENILVEISADIDVQFGVIPCVTENGRTYQLGYKRKTWFRKKIEGGNHVESNIF
jgi:hypothetical protein